MEKHVTSLENVIVSLIFLVINAINVRMVTVIFTMVVKPDQEVNLFSLLETMTSGMRMTNTQMEK